MLKLAVVTVGVVHCRWVATVAAAAAAAVVAFMFLVAVFLVSWLV